ncbi:MAG: cation diffusion facilitator family transporter [Gammaproteobacteria bacterium]
MHVPTRNHATSNAADERYLVIRRVTLIGGVVDLLLGAVKILVGLAAYSQALVADGIHSLSDFATDVLVVFAAKHGSRGADEDHPYGHGRVETVATVILGVTLIAVGAGVAYGALDRLLHMEKLLHPGIWALIIAAVSVVAKEWIYRYTVQTAKRIHSNMLLANAWHSRSDAISSVVVMVGVGGTIAGLPYLDALAATVVALMIAKIGWDLGWHSLLELIDTALEAERVMAIRRAIVEVPGVRAMHLLRTRCSGGAALVDVHIQVQPTLSVSEGHQIGETVRAKLIENIDEVTDVTVHIDPENDEDSTLCDQLPGRQEILSQLFGQWQGLLDTQDADKVTLHYLSGKVDVDVVLSLDLAAGDCQKARSLSAALVDTAKDLDDIGEVKVYFR